MRWIIRVYYYRSLCHVKRRQETFRGRHLFCRILNKQKYSYISIDVIVQGCIKLFWWFFIDLTEKKIKNRSTVQQKFFNNECFFLIRVKISGRKFGRISNIKGVSNNKLDIVDTSTFRKWFFEIFINLNIPICFIFYKYIMYTFMYLWLQKV